MIAIVTSYQNKGKITNLNSFWVRFKVGLWFLLTPVRPLIMKMWYFLRNKNLICDEDFIYFDLQTFSQNKKHKRS
jgi:hypothetical protein